MAERKIYYSEKVRVVLPVYLNEYHVNYKIIIKNRQPITGVLNSSREISALEMLDKHTQVTLVLFVFQMELKRIDLSISDDIKIKEVSLKSTVSETCAEPGSTCSFKLKLDIYTINKQSNKAVLLSLGEIEKIAEKHNLVAGYYIKRRTGGISKTSKDTINQINNPDTITNKYIKYALGGFKKRCNVDNSDFPRLLYRDLMKDVFECFLKNAKNTDDIINEIGDVFGENIEDSYMKEELLAFYHVYEALVPKTFSSPGYDKVQHFTYCVKKAYNSIKILADVAQYTGEAYDLLMGGSIDDTKSDMEANNLGQNYGYELYKRYHPVRAAIRNLD